MGAAPDDPRPWLWNIALPLWASVGADPAGGFYEGIDFEGRPWLSDRRLRVQARQTWVYATALRRAPSARWEAAMEHGLEHLLGPFRRPDGLFHALVGPDGVALDAPALLYDQAFVLLALAAVERVRPGLAGVRDHAVTLMRRIGETYRLPATGFREASTATPFYANPHMHLFEALLAWEAIDAGGGWSTEADALAALALDRFIGPASGALREHFDADWNPALGVAGSTVEPGHQFEWSWLLRRWGRARGREDAVAAADRLFEIGAGWGVDRSRGVVFNSLLDDLTPLDRATRLWPHAEWLKAAISRGDLHGCADVDEQARQAAAALRLFTRTEIPGLWRDTLSAEGVFTDRFAPASSLYHIAGAIFELDPRPA